MVNEVTQASDSKVAGGSSRRAKEATMKTKKSSGVSPALTPQILRLTSAPSSSLHGLESIVPLLAQVIGSNCEIVLHDFALLPNSIVAIGGDLTHRAVGDTINPFALERIREGADRDLINYQVELGDGRILRSSTIFVRDDEGTALGCLCLNFDVSDLLKIREVIDALTVSVGIVPDSTVAKPEVVTFNETFPRTVEDVMAETVSHAILNIGVEPTLMHKRHKLEVVRLLEERGLFLVRDAVDYVAKELKVTRFTIYNYLNELKVKDQGDSPSPRRTSSRGRERGVANNLSADRTPQVAIVTKKERK